MFKYFFYPNKYTTFYFSSLKYSVGSDLICVISKSFDFGPYNTTDCTMTKIYITQIAQELTST